MSEWQINVDADVEARILAAADHEEGDRVPVWDYVDNPAAFEYFRRPEDEDAHDTMRRLYHELGIDLCRGYCIPQSEEEKNEARTRWARRRIETPKQLEAELKGDRGDWDAFAQQLIGQYRWMRDKLAPRTMYVPGGGTGLTGLYAATGLQRFCEWTCEHDDLIGAVLAHYAEDSVLWAATAARERLCPLFFIGEDIAYKERLIFSPAWLRRRFIPHLRSMCEPLAAAGIKVIFHSDGNVMEILDELIEAGISGLNPIEPIAGMDIGYLKKRYGKRLILVGNVDCSQVLPFGTPEEVREAVKACVRAASRGGGHFIGSSSELTPSTPLENVLAFYDACHRFGRYPIQV
jgi:hypothetical protein